MTAASGFAVGENALPELAAVAVKDALTNAGADYAHGVVLLLSGHFVHGIHHAQAAVTAASRAASCLQICGCTVPGVFTEHAWALDRPAAAALVLCGSISLALPREEQARLSFATPAAADPKWIGDGTQRFGTLATDNEAQAEGQVWTQAKIVPGAHVETCFHGASLHIGTSRGVRALSPPLEVRDCDNFEVLQLNDQPALDSLLRRLDPATRKMEALPPQLIFAALPEPGITPKLAAASGRYTLLPILRVNRDERSVTLAAPLPLHATMWWVLREPASAEQDMVQTLHRLKAVDTEPPAFGLMFSCIGRGPYFYQGHDRDVELTRAVFPGLPLLGAYGAGEIAPFGPPDNQRSNLISYSSVLALVTAHV